MSTAPLILNRGAGLGDWSASRPAVFSQRKDSTVPIESEAGWALGLV
jgi:hypothetical protein